MMHAEHGEAIRKQWRMNTQFWAGDKCAMDDWARKSGGPFRTSVYSQDLYEVMRDCLKLMPETRPSVSKLRHDIHHLFSRREHDWEKRFGRFTGLGIEERLQVLHQGDLFPIGKRHRKKRRRELDDDLVEESDGERYLAAKTTPLPPLAAPEAKKVERNRWDTGIKKG